MHLSANLTCSPWFWVWIRGYLHYYLKSLSHVIKHHSMQFIKSSSQKAFKQPIGPNEELSSKLKESHEKSLRGLVHAIVGFSRSIEFQASILLIQKALLIQICTMIEKSLLMWSSDEKVVWGPVLLSSNSMGKQPLGLQKDLQLPTLTGMAWQLLMVEYCQCQFLPDYPEVLNSKLPSRTHSELSNLHETLEQQIHFYCHGKIFWNIYQGRRNR